MKNASSIRMIGSAGSLIISACTLSPNISPQGGHFAMTFFSCSLVQILTIGRTWAQLLVSLMPTICLKYVQCVNVSISHDPPRKHHSSSGELCDPSFNLGDRS